jgi:tRNA(Ile)-lysidine synthase
MKTKTVPTIENPPVNKPKQPIVERVEAVIRDNILAKDGDRIIVAVSGGSDSLALLHVLRAIDMQLQLIAVYIDHGLRPQETPHEQQTILQSCQSLGIRSIVRTIDVRRFIAQKKHSPEEAARILRYQALEELRRQNDANSIATGHTADDQVEEFFLRLIRGSSRRGLSGMAVRRDRIIRPLLHETKDALAEYLTALGVRWCLDSSNLHRHFLRNRVRLDLLPLLEKDFSPAIRRTVLRNMNLLAEEESYLESRSDEAFAGCVTPSDRLSDDGSNRVQLVVEAELFARQHLAIRRRILEKCFWRMSIRPTSRQIDKLIGLLESGISGRELHLDDGVRAERHPSHLLFCRPLEPGRIRGSRLSPPAVNLEIAEPGRYPVKEYDRELVIEEAVAPVTVTGDGARLVVDRAGIVFPLLLRSALPGERFHPYNSPGPKKVGRYFTDRKIPAGERAAWPVLLSGDTIIALPGLQIDHTYRVTEKTSGVLVIDWLKTARP